jgi:hypothetical protein
MAITTYLDYDEVRAALGVSTNELDDTTLALSLYDSGLTEELEAISANLPGAYTTVAALTTRTAVQQRLFRMTRLFAIYAVAKQLLPGLPMFAPKDITDGKAAAGRFSNDPYKVTIDEVKKQYELNKQRLEDAFILYNSGSVITTLRTYVSVSNAGSDPVTGV